VVREREALETAPACPTHATGDLLLLFGECSSGSISTPSGWTVIPGFPVTHNGGSTVINGFYFVAVSNSTSAPSLSGGTNHMWGVIVGASGVKTSNPFMAVAGSPGTGASVAGYAPGLVTPEANAKILNIIAWSLDNAGGISSAEANASLTSVTEEYDAGTVTNDGGGLVIISGIKAAAGAVSSTTCTLTSTSFCSATVALRPSIATPYTVADTVTINGVAAANGGDVEVWDTIDGVLAGATTIAGGAGGFTLDVPYNDADRYRVVYDDGTWFGASPKGTAA
jgi:hypothetical protein